MTDFVNDIRSWTFQVALPFWYEHGIDREAGGYIERFDAQTLAPHTESKRIRVIARQIYVFAHAGILGFEQGHEAARWGFDFLKSHAWVDQQSGWAQTLDRNGMIINSNPELYDQAFVLFALSWYYKSSKDPEALALAHKTLDTLDEAYRADIGYWHALPPSGHRQQNPHMHMLEAMLSWYEVHPTERFERIANEIVTMFNSFFYNSESQTLCEFFDYNWHPAPGEDGRLTEPGHQFEWAWILVNFQRIFGVDTSKEAKGLIVFAEKHGVDPKTNITFQQVRNDGSPIDLGARVWPNTERLKAAAALHDLEGKDPKPVFEQSTKVLMERYLAGPKPGLWIEKFNADGQPTSNIVPTSTFYHVFLAFSEVLRVMENMVEG